MPENFPYDERETLRLIAVGNARAFANLFDRYHKKIYSLAYHLTESAPQAEEIVQDVFLKIWMKQADLPSILHFENYLFIVARNHIYSQLKKMARNRLVSIESEPALPDDAETPEDQLVHKESAMLLQQAVSRLPLQQHTVYKLSRENGLTREQIAEKLNLSPETIKVHLSRAMRSIRAYIIAKRELLLLLLNIFWLR